MNKKDNSQFVKVKQLNKNYKSSFSKIKEVEFLDKSENFIKLLSEKQKHNGFFIIKFVKEN